MIFFFSFYISILTKVCYASQYKYFNEKLSGVFREDRGSSTH